MTNVVDCAGAAERDLASLYLAGKLPEDVAQAFELHYLQCEGCWRDAQLGAKLRESLGRPAVRPLTKFRRRRRPWLPLVAAAVVAFGGIGVWELTRQAAVARARHAVLGGDAFGLRVEPGRRGEIDVTWPPQPDAANYEIEVIAASGSRVWKTETHEPHLRIGPGAFPAPSRGQGYSVRVEELDSTGHVVATSRPTPLSGS